ncbi:hypothetical protein GCM10009805_14790 [Leucobacter chromiireducens subsp. solipictus]
MKTRGQRDFEARIRKSRGVAHPAAPVTGAAGWATRCARTDCDRTFLTPTKQRKYCSTQCRRITEQAKHRRVEVLAGMLLYSCAAERCSKVFLPDPHAPHQVYCSARCRKRDHRAMSDLSSPTCVWCTKPLPQEKTRRRSYCGPTCRKRAQRAAEKDEN